MKQIDDFVEALAAEDESFGSLWEMIKDFEEFEDSFYIGDCLLTRNAQLLSKAIFGGDGNESIIVIINLLALHIYKFFTIKYKKSLTE